MATPGIEADDPINANGNANLSEAERELLLEELKKTEDEVNTLRQLLIARQKHVAHLKRKLGISPLNELTTEMAQGLKTVKDTPAYQKTSEVVTGTAETVASKFNDIRNSSFFKSFETKLGSAVSSAKMAASTSIDHLANVAGGGQRPSTSSNGPNANAHGADGAANPSPIS